MYAYFEGCDPIQAGLIQRPDQMIPLLVAKVFRDTPGMAGLFVSAAVSGTLRYFILFFYVLTADSWSVLQG